MAKSSLQPSKKQKTKNKLWFGKNNLRKILLRKVTPKARQRIMEIVAHQTTQSFVCSLLIRYWPEIGSRIMFLVVEILITGVCVERLEKHSEEKNRESSYRRI